MSVRPVWWVTLASLATVGISALALGGCQKPPPAAPPTPTTPPTEVNAQEKIGLRWLKQVGAEEQYAGNQACRSCHAAEFKSHAKSPHAFTMRRLEAGEKKPEFASTQTVTDPYHNITYRVGTDTGGDWLEATADGKTERAVPHWQFGSGTHARTYLSHKETGFLEHRITYYSRARKWDFTPGRDPKEATTGPLGQVYNSLEVSSCFGCHSTVLVGVAGKPDFERSILNVGCESCHGPARSHVESATQFAQAVSKGGAAPASMVKPERLTGDAIMRLCGSCHRVPEDFATGDMSVETQLPRFPGVGLARSRCFIESGGKLTCVTCHQPHQRARTGPTAYDVTCKSCHGAPPQRKCAAGKTSQCAPCHLPEQPISAKLPLKFHNHWIRAKLSDEERLMFGGE